MIGGGMFFYFIINDSTLARPDMRAVAKLRSEK